MAPRFWKNEDGAFAVAAALGLPVLVTGAVLGTEVGMWAFQHQAMQGAADAAALAGVVAKTSGAALTIQGQALTAMSGFANGVNGVSVQINSPPLSGPYASRTDAVEVMIQKPYAPVLAKFISNNQVVVGARAVAIPNPGGACVLALDPAAAGAITLQGAARVTLNGCNATANSASASAISAGGASSLTVASAAAVGGISGTSHITASNGLQTGITAVSDPYATSSYPPFDPASAQTIPNSGPILPGVWKGDIKGAITLSQGVYYFDAGSFKLNANGSLYGRDVTVVFTSITGWPKGPIINGNSNVDLTAPNVGPTAGIVFFGDRSMPAGTQITINGTTDQSWGGAVYLPQADLTFTGGASGASGCTQIIADRVTFTGNSNLSLDCVGTGVTSASNQIAVLVE